LINQIDEKVFDSISPVQQADESRRDQLLAKNFQKNLLLRHLNEDFQNTSQPNYKEPESLRSNVSKHITINSDISRISKLDDPSRGNFKKENFTSSFIGEFNPD
jgi:hypothetical protein